MIRLIFLLALLFPFSAKAITVSDCSFANPGADSVLFWDHSDSDCDILTLGTGLAISGNTFSVQDIYVLVAGDAMTGPLSIASNSATAFAVGPNGATNPAFTVDGSTASADMGVTILGGTTGASITTTGNDTNGSLNLASKGSGAFNISTGNNSGNVNLRINSSNRLSIGNTLSLLSNIWGIENGSTSAGVFRFYEDSDDGSNYASIQAQAMSANTVYTLPADDGDADEQLTTDGSGNLTWEAAGGSGSPGGSDTYVQFNDSSSFGGDAGLVFNKTTDNLTVGNDTATGGQFFAGNDNAGLGNVGYSFSSATTTGFGYYPTTPALLWSLSGSYLFGLVSSGFAFDSSRGMKWGSNVLGSGTHVGLYQGGTGILRITDGAFGSGIGSLLASRVVEAHTEGSGSPHSIDRGESRKVFTNEGATAMNYQTLPGAAAGVMYSFTVEDSDGMRITAATGDTIRIGGSVTAAAGYIESTTVGDTVTLLAINSTEWVAVGATGTWADPAALKTIFIPATAMKPTTTAGCADLASVEISSSQPEVFSLDCDASTDEKAQFQFVPPKGWDNGTISYAVYWSHASTSTNFGVVFGMECLAVSNDDTIGAAYGTAQTVSDTGGTTDDLYVSPTSSALTVGGTPQDADEVFCRVYRDADNGSDNMAIDARLMGVAIFYTQATGDDT